MTRSRKDCMTRTGRPYHFDAPMPTITFRLPAPMIAELRVLAREREMSVSDVIRELIVSRAKRRDRTMRRRATEPES